MVNDRSQFTMEQSQEGVVLLQHLEKDFRIFFAEVAILELGICNCLTCLRGGLITIIDAVKTLWVLDDHIEPEIRFNLTEYVCVGRGRNALDRSFNLRERLKEVDDALADSDLLSLLMDIHSVRVKEHDLDVGKLLLAGLVRTLG